MLAHRRWRWASISPALRQRVVFSWTHCICITANTIHWASVGLLLAHRLRRWPNIMSTMAQFIFFPGILFQCDTAVWHHRYVLSPDKPGFFFKGTVFFYVSPTAVLVWSFANIIINYTVELFYSIFTVPATLFSSLILPITLLSFFSPFY